MVSTAAILIGASKFPKHAYGETQSFATSSRDFRAYLQDGEVGLDVADENILNLFDSARSGSDQLMSIGRFLDRLATQANTETARDVILYYVGHGSFAGERQDYILAISSMDPSYEAVTGLRVADLAGVLKDRARHFRFFVILDCCFAGEALDTFQSADPSEAAARKAATWFDSGRPKRQSRSPTRGIALLCAADRDSPAYGAADHGRTMFTDGLLNALKAGDPSASQRLSLAEIRDLTWEDIERRHRRPVRPTLHCPDQTDGDIAQAVALFPNAAFTGNPNVAGALDRQPPLPPGPLPSAQENARADGAQPEHTGIAGNGSETGIQPKDNPAQETPQVSPDRTRARARQQVSFGLAAAAVIVVGSTVLWAFLSGKREAVAPPATVAQPTSELRCPQGTMSNGQNCWPIEVPPLSRTSKRSANELRCPAGTFSNGQNCWPQTPNK